MSRSIATLNQLFRDKKITYDELVAGLETFETAAAAADVRKAEIAAAAAAAAAAADADVRKAEIAAEADVRKAEIAAENGICFYIIQNTNSKIILIIDFSSS